MVCPDWAPLSVMDSGLKKVRLTSEKAGHHIEARMSFRDMSLRIYGRNFDEVLRVTKGEAL